MGGDVYSLYFCGMKLTFRHMVLTAVFCLCSAGGGQVGASVQQQLYGADVGQTGNSGGRLPEGNGNAVPSGEGGNGGYVGKACREPQNGAADELRQGAQRYCNDQTVIFV